MQTQCMVPSPFCIACASLLHGNECETFFPPPPCAINKAVHCERKMNNKRLQFLGASTGCFLDYPVSCKHWDGFCSPDVKAAWIHCSNTCCPLKRTQHNPLIKFRLRNLQHQAELRQMAQKKPQTFENLTSARFFFPPLYLIWSGEGKGSSRLFFPCSCSHNSNKKQCFLATRW